MTINVRELYRLLNSWSREQEMVEEQHTQDVAADLALTEIQAQIDVAETQGQLEEMACLRFEQEMIRLGRWGHNG